MTRHARDAGYLSSPKCSKLGCAGCAAHGTHAMRMGMSVGQLNSATAQAFSNPNTPPLTAFV